MDQQHRGFSLLAYLVVIQLVLGCLVGSGATEPDESSADVIRLIHPTMHRAFLLDDGNTLLETNTLALIRSSNTSYRRLVKYPGAYSPDVATAAKISSSSTNYYPSKRKPNYTPQESAELLQKSIAVLRITYDNEIDIYKKAYANLIDSNFGRGSTCHKQAFRAFDLVRIPKVKSIIDSAVAVGFSDTHICLFYYDLFDPTRVRDDPFGTATKITEMPLPVVGGPAMNPCYRVASATIVASGLSQGFDVVVQYYDEAGQIISFIIKSPNSYAPIIYHSVSITCLSAVNLIQDGKENTDYEDEAAKRDLNDRRTSVMRQHFEHSFVESIAMHDGGLTYTRGLFHNRNYNFVNKTDHNWPKILEVERGSGITNVALEIYKYNETYYFHIFDIKLTEKHKQSVDPSVQYEWCRIGTRELAKRVSSSNSSKPCEISDYKPKWAPIDVVYRAQCNKVYAFYQHLVQSESATEKFKRNSSYTVLEWMRFPVNAILHYKDRLYLFGPANNLRISAPIGDDCTFEQVSVPDEDFYQSDLLFMFSEAAGGAKHPGSPFYDSERYFNGRSWMPPLDNQKEIPKELLLHSPEGDDKFSSMLIVLLLIATILVLLALAYLYFARTRNQAQEKRSEFGPGSNIRQRKSGLSARAGARSSDRKLKPSPYSTLNSPTIRSGHHLPVENPPTLRTFNDPTAVKPQRSMQARQTSGGVGKPPSSLGKTPIGAKSSRTEASTSSRVKPAVPQSRLGKSVVRAAGFQSLKMSKPLKTAATPRS